MAGWTLEGEEISLHSDSFRVDWSIGAVQELVSDA
jgi:hypothetical protein